MRLDRFDRARPPTEPITERLHTFLKTRSRRSRRLPRANSDAKPYSSATQSGRFTLLATARDERLGFSLISRRNIREKRKRSVDAIDFIRSRKQRRTRGSGVCVFSPLLPTVSRRGANASGARKRGDLNDPWMKFAIDDSRTETSGHERGVARVY